VKKQEFRIEPLGGNEILLGIITQTINFSKKLNYKKGIINW
jgi:hypothetical protein